MTPRLELRNIRKSFGATQALGGVDLLVAPGEVHAIIGENGAGKSTLMKVLSGAHRPDEGTIFLDGNALHLRDPRQSLAAGIAMIYQELNLAPELSVTENLFLGGELSYYGRVCHREQRRRAQQALANLHREDIDPDRPVGDLSIAQQQMVEIARAICRSEDLKLLILDEPTSSLTRQDSDQMFALIERLSSAGTSVLYISHFLEECQQIADRFTVLRDGHSVGTGDLQSTSLPKIIDMMVGREIKDLYPQFTHTIGEPVVTVRQLSGVRAPSNVDLTLHRGEIYGLAGLIGSGRTETIRAIFGLDQMVASEILIGQQSRRDRSPAKSWHRDSMGLVSEDRKREGLMLDRSLNENMTLPSLSQYRSGPFLNHHRLRESTVSQLESMKTKCSGPDQTIANLSGGNQQKVAIGRLLQHDCEIYILDEPTRGIDIGSKQTIYETIAKLAAAGKTILMVSSYLPELLGICDTIGVISRGRLVASKPRSQWDESSLLSSAL